MDGCCHFRNFFIILFLFYFSFQRNEHMYFVCAMTFHLFACNSILHLNLQVLLVLLEIHSLIVKYIYDVCMKSPVDAPFSAGRHRSIKEIIIYVCSMFKYVLAVSTLKLQHIYKCT